MKIRLVAPAKIKIRNPRLPRVRLVDPRIWACWRRDEDGKRIKGPLLRSADYWDCRVYAIKQVGERDFRRCFDIGLWYGKGNWRNVHGRS